ncbi:MAG: hypothetical protein JXA95_00965 [Spirochaetales bacterium]|nr:hypothetical protein [Spirochaetales bacterium]
MAKTYYGLVVGFLFFLPLLLHGQQAQGLQPLPSAVNLSQPQANPHGIVSEADGAPGSGRGGESLPVRVDLRRYLPPVKSQGRIASCSAWSTVYYAKTLQENQEREWGADARSHQYSPLFTYNQITGGVNSGTSIMDHMIILEKQGAASLDSFPYTDNILIQPDRKALQEAELYRAESHKTLDLYDPATKTWSVELKAVKAALAQGLPVVGGFEIYENFYSYRGGIYNRIQGASLGGHAMCIVGYDDKKNALHIVNSWGTDWGEEGFLWLDYDLFETLCHYNCAVMYDRIDSLPDRIASPSGLIGSRGAYKDRIELTWNPVEGADSYRVYRADNKDRELKEIARTERPLFSEEELPSGVNYIYAVTSIRTGSTGSLESEFSEIAEGWTMEDRSPPGIPSNLTCRFFNEKPVLVWEPVEEARGYSLYRWSEGEDDFILIGRSGDAAYMDDSFGDIAGGGMVYYFVQAYNDYGEGYPSVSLPVLKELEEEVTILPIQETRDDRAVAFSEQKSFEGEYYRTDFFDYEFTLARFKEYYDREMKAFRDFQKKEADDFEAWKKQNDWRSQ